LVLDWDRRVVKPVLLIRAENNETDQAALTKLGIPSLIDPYLEIRVSEDSTEAEQLLSLLEGSDDPVWLIATSVNSFKFWSQIVGADRLRSAITKHPEAKFAAVGEATANILRTFGANEVLISHDFTGQSLAEDLLAEDLVGRAFVPGGNLAMKSLPSALESAGWGVSTATVYTTSPVAKEPTSARMIRDKEVSTILFRSPSAVRALTHFVPNPEVDLVCIGPTTASALTDQGLIPSAVSPAPSAEVVASTIYSLLC
jgi:uroporphyrinogen-III synthase